MQDLIKVMIVDDEILAVEDLQNLIPWQQHGYEVVVTAVNSRNALELYEQYRPRIIFVDIRMPVMDGLEFSQRIISCGYPVKIILLTAYKDFEYAKRAVEIGVANYLLKHDINEESLLKVLEKVRRELENDESRNLIIRQQFIRETLESESPEERAELKETRLFPKREGNLGLLLVQPDVPYLDEFAVHNKLSAVKVLNLQSMALPESIQWIEGFNLDETRAAIIIGIKKINSRSRERESFYQLALTIQKHLKEEDQGTISLVITHTCRGIEGLPALYRAAVKTFEYRPFYGRDKILYSEDLPVITNLDETNLDPVFRKLSRSLSESEVAKTNELIKGLFTRVAAVYNPEGLKIICRELLYILEHYRKDNNLSPLADLFKQGKLDTRSLYYVWDIQDWFSEQFSLTIRQIYDAAIKFSKKVQQVIQYIHRYYAEDLTVDNVAEALGISGVYLSQIFKKETNQTFLEYLTGHRIKIARKLLAEGGYKVYEVAEMVGYKTSQYFSQVFKKVTGMYPLDYREGGSKNETWD